MLSMILRTIIEIVFAICGTIIYAIGSIISSIFS